MATSVQVGNSTLPSKTYLQQCQEDLEPGRLSSWQWKSTGWQVAAVTTLVAYTALAVGSLAAAVFYAPIYIPLVAVTGVFFLKFVQQGSNVFEQWSSQASARAEQIKQISQNYQALSSATPQQLQQTLLEKGIPWLFIPGMARNPENLSTIKPLIARDAFWVKHIEELEKQKQSKISEASKLSAENHEKNRYEIHDLRCQALNLENAVLASKIKNAFINAVILRPDFKGSLEDVGTISSSTGQERAIKNAVGTSSAIEFFTFKNRQTPSITVDDVKRMRIADLALRLLPGMA